MATEPLTGARYPTQQDAPLGGLQIGYAVQDLAAYSLPRFATAAVRDAAYVSWVANGGTLTDGMRCIVGAYEMARVGGVWRYTQGVLVVPDRTARDNLATYDGLTIHQVDTGQMLRRVGGTWRLAGVERYTNGSTSGSNSMAGTSWQGTTFANVPTDLGNPIVIPADGVARNLDVIATASIAGDMYMRVAVIVGGGGTAYFPNTNGVRSIASAGQEQPITVLANPTPSGTATYTVQIEARATAAGSGSIYVASLRVLA